MASLFRTLYFFLSGSMRELPNVPGYLNTCFYADCYGYVWGKRINEPLSNVRVDELVFWRQTEKDFLDGKETNNVEYPYFY